VRSPAFESVAVGFFDGVHLGHRAILSKADVAVTFRNHPLSVLRPEEAPRLIMTCERRIEAMRACGVREVVAMPFTAETSRLSPREFLDSAGISSGTRIFCGRDWRFGRGGGGCAKWLEENGYGVTTVPDAEYRGGRISSSRIRACIESGGLEDACAMLGRPFEVEGTVFRGKGLGASIGFPTVNVRPENLFLDIPFGVYAAETSCGGAVANYGLAPTLGGDAWREPVLELHFPGGSCDAAPGSPMRAGLLRFLRPERKFPSLPDLKRQIEADCEQVRARLRYNPGI